MRAHHRSTRRRAAQYAGIGAILVLAFVAILPVVAEGQNAVVRASPAVLDISAGQIAALDVVLVDVQGVYGIDLRAAFDPQAVEVVDADPAAAGVQLTPGGFPQPDFVARNTADNQAGTLRYAVTQVNPTEPVDGSGIVFTVQFRAKATSGQSTFSITAVDVTDRDGIALAVQPESGLIRIVASGNPSSTPSAPTRAATATAVATPLVDTPTPTDVPLSPATASPAPPASTPALPPAPADAPTSPSPLATLPAAAMASPGALPADPPPQATPTAAAAAGVSVTPTAAPSIQPALQAVSAAAPSIAGASAGPLRLTVESGPAATGASPTLVTPGVDSEPGQGASSFSLLPRPRAADGEADANRATPANPSPALLIVGIVALTVAIASAVLILAILRR